MRTLKIFTAMSIFSIAMSVAAAASAQIIGDVDAPWPSEPFIDCDVWEKALVCDDLVTGECEEVKACKDNVLQNDESLESDGGGTLPLAIDCSEISGYAADANDIWIGTIMINKGGGIYESTGLFGYCKRGTSHAAVLEECSTVANPLHVRASMYSDALGAVPPGIVKDCVGDKSIGDWSHLDHFAATTLQIYGCGEMDWLYGSPNTDYLAGGSSDDTIYAGDGNDYVCGDKASLPPYAWCQSAGECLYLDTGSPGADVIAGEAGIDQIAGFEGNDFIHGGIGNDILGGYEGADTIYGYDGNDRITGGPGADTIWGGRGCDFVEAREGDDYIYLYMTSASTSDLCSAPYYNEAYGEDDNDHIYGAKDAMNRMWGGPGDDTIVRNNMMDYICGGKGRYDYLDGGNGTDFVVDYFAASDGDLAMNQTIYGNTGDNDVVCYFDEGGNINNQGWFYLNGGNGSGDGWYCDGEPRCSQISCENPQLPNRSKCTNYGAFTCPQEYHP